MRRAFSIIGLPLATLSAVAVSCVDEPITSAHLAENGQLRSHLEQQAFTGEAKASPEIVAQSLQLTAVLANQPGGALQDSTSFGNDGAMIHLHIRPDRLDSPRAVRFVWSHKSSEAKRESMGFLIPSKTLTLASSLPGDEAKAGTWTVQVFEVTSHDQPALLFTREFLVE